MNDTHGVRGQGWYGFDLDGTLAEYNGWQGIDHIGEPIKPIVDIVRRYHDSGKIVKIMTARIAPRQNDDGTFGEQHVYVKSEYGETLRYTASYYIKKWCQQNLGFCPEIVYQKDALMLWLFDDRVVQVEPNTGKVLGRLPEWSNVLEALTMSSRIEKLKAEFRQLVLKKCKGEITADEEKRLDEIQALRRSVRHW